MSVETPAVRRGRAGGRDDGSIVLLTVGYAMIAIALIVVAVDASAFFLSRRALAGLADGAALAGTHAENADVLYSAGPGAEVPLTEPGVRSHVTAYLAGHDAAGTSARRELTEVVTDGRTVSVSLTEDKPLPFLSLVNSLTGAFPGGTARIEVTARANAPVTP